MTHLDDLVARALELRDARDRAQALYEQAIADIAAESARTRDEQ